MSWIISHAISAVKSETPHAALTAGRMSLLMTIRLGYQNLRAREQDS